MSAIFIPRLFTSLFTSLAFSHASRVSLPRHLLPCVFHCHGPFLVSFRVPFFALFSVIPCKTFSCLITPLSHSFPSGADSGEAGNRGSFSKDLLRIRGKEKEGKERKMR